MLYLWKMIQLRCRPFSASQRRALSTAFSTTADNNSGCSPQISAQMLSLSCWIVCGLLMYCIHAPLDNCNENNQEASNQENVMAKKFLIFAKLFGVQKFALEAAPWLVPCGQWPHLVETTSQVYPSLQDAQNSRAWLDTAH